MSLHVLISYSMHPYVNISYMYGPIIETLLRGLQFLDISAVVRYKQLNETIENITNSLTSGQTFIWIGPVHSKSINWKYLKSRNIKNIYYQTEPIQSTKDCFLYSDEVWDYSPT